jgi:hypothetical protein
MKHYLKGLIILCVSFILSDCRDSQPEKNKDIYFYYLPYYQNRLLADTIKYEKENRITSGDQLVATEHFKYREQYHSINFYSSEHTAPVDGGELKYTLDSLGVIYSRAVWWPNFEKLSSDNDSINDLISTAMGYILMKSSLRCYYCDDRYTYLPKRVEVSE